MVDDGTDNMQILIDDLYFYNFFSRSETANLFAVLFHFTIVSARVLQDRVTANCHYFDPLGEGRRSDCHKCSTSSL